MRGFADGVARSLRTGASAADPSRGMIVAEAALVLGARSSHFTRRRAMRSLPPLPEGVGGGTDAGDGHVPALDAVKSVVRGACGCGARADMPSAEASGAICVQGLDDSRSSAIRITYRISLRSSSIQEPRYPSSGVVSATRGNSVGGVFFVVSLHATSVRTAPQQHDAGEGAWPRTPHGMGRVES